MAGMELRRAAGVLSNAGEILRLLESWLGYCGMLRILAVTNMFPAAETPSNGTFVEQQISGLRRIGLEVDLIFIDRAREGMRGYSGLGEKTRVRIIQFQPDLVHVMYGGIMADLVTRAICSTPAIASFCGSDLLGELLSGPIRRVVAAYGVAASRRAARRAHGIIVKSENLQRALPEDVDSAKVRIIPNGVDLERFKPMDRSFCRDQLKWDQNQFHVLFQANSGDPVKRPALARAAVERVNQTGVPAIVHELRGIPHSQVPLWVNASDVLLLTSLHEGSPNIVKEALACNVPVVSVDVGDVCERINGIEGCYLAAAEAADLADKLQLVYNGYGRIDGRAAMNKCSLESVALRLKAFYLEVISSYRRSIGRPERSRFGPRHHSKGVGAKRCEQPSQRVLSPSKKCL